MKIRGPNDLPVDMIRAAMDKKCSVLLRMFCTCGLPLNRTWKMLDVEDQGPGLKTVDLWYWAIVSSSPTTSRALRNHEIMPNRTEDAVDHMAYATDRIHDAMMDSSTWGSTSSRDSSLDIFEGIMAVLYDLIAVTAANGAAIDGNRPLNLTPLLAVLASDRGKSTAAHTAAKQLLEDHRERLASSDKFEAVLLKMDEPGSTIYADTPLWEAVEIQWIEMMQLLLEHGADPHATAGPYSTPYKPAQSLGSEELLELFDSQASTTS